MDSVAKRAGMSRSTAFRQVGSVYELVVQVALCHARQHINAIRQLIAETTDVFGQLEAALVYSSSQLRTDTTISALITEHANSAHHPHVHAAAMDVLGPVMFDGGERGMIRTDLDVHELVAFVVEQIYLAAQAEDVSTNEARRRFRHFVVPGIGGADTARATQPRHRPEIDAAVQSTLTAVDELARVLRNQSL
jgi:AcrR family transcriptional regulator